MAPRCVLCQHAAFLRAKVAVSLPCGHVFHKDCVSEWQRVVPSCPSCPLFVSHLQYLKMRPDLPFDDTPEELAFELFKTEGDLIARQQERKFDEEVLRRLKAERKARMDAVQAKLSELDVKLDMHCQVMEQQKVFIKKLKALIN